MLRYGFAWRGVIPLLRGGDAGMDASSTMMAAAVAFAAEYDATAPFDLLSGAVRLPRRLFDIEQPSQVEDLRAELASTILATGCRVTARATSAGANAEMAAARSGPQGVETRRLAGAQPPLDESLGPIKSRLAQPAAAPRALLLNRRLGGGAAAAEEEVAEVGVEDLEWAPGGGLEAMAAEPTHAAEWAREEEDQREEAGATEAAAWAAATAAAEAVRSAAEERAALRRRRVVDPESVAWLAAAERGGVEAAAAAAADVARAAVIQAAVARAARVAEPEEDWEVMEEARERGQQPEEEEEAWAFEELLRHLRCRLGVRRMPRLSESEGYAKAHAGVKGLVDTIHPQPSLAVTLSGTGCTTRRLSPTSQTRPAGFRPAPWFASGRVGTARCLSSSSAGIASPRAPTLVSAPSLCAARCDGAAGVLQGWAMAIDVPAFARCSSM